MASRGLAYSLIQCFTGSLSIIGSSSIICMIVLDRKKKLTKPNHRLMLMMSIFDVFSSAAIATSRFAFPKSSSLSGAIGNMTTCKVQFFFVTLGLTVPMYNASLSLLYLFTIRHRVSLTHFANKIEPYLHAVSVLTPLTIAIVSILRDEVDASYDHFTCALIVGSFMSWPLPLVPFFSFLISVYSMAMVSHAVWSQSGKMKSYSYSSTQLQRQNSEVKATVKQAILYVSAFVITFIFPLLGGILTNSFIIAILKSIFYPLQGFWNFLLYIRPLVTKMKEENNDKCLVNIIWDVVFHSHDIDAETDQTRLKNRATVMRTMKTKHEEDEESKEEIHDELDKPITSENQNKNVPNCDEYKECNRSAKTHTPLVCKNGDDNLETTKQVRRVPASLSTLVWQNDHDDNLEATKQVRRLSAPLTTLVRPNDYDDIISKQDRRVSRRGSNFFFATVLDDDSANLKKGEESDEKM